MCLSHDFKRVKVAGVTTMFQNFTAMWRHYASPNMLNLFVLLYADDIVIMAENWHGMQRNLDLLNEYCICNKLKVNISKTKMMVLARSKTRIRNIGQSVSQSVSQ